MKKAVVAALAAVFCAATASAEVYWSTWTDGEQKNDNVEGTVLGFGSSVKSLKGAQVTVCVNKCEKEVHSGAQVTFGYNRTGKLRNGAQVGFWNQADSAALQFGLICFNKTGFLPFFVFFNMDTSMFGSGK